MTKETKRHRAHHGAQERFLRSARALSRRISGSTSPATDTDTTIAILKAQQEATLDGILVVDHEGQVLTYNKRFLEIWKIPEEVAARGDDDELLLWADRCVVDPQAFRKDVASLYEAADTVRTNDILHFRDGSVLSRTSVPVVSDGVVAGRAWYFRDITEAKKAEIVQSALFRISELSRSASDLPALYRSIHRILGELMDVTNFYIAMHHTDTGRFHFPYFIDEMDPEPPHSPLGRGLTHWVLQHGEALLATPAVFEELIRRGEVESIGAPSVDWLGVPLTVEGKTYGVLGVQSYTTSVRYSEKDKDILVFVSQHVAGAIEHRRREEALRESELRYRQMFQTNSALKLLIDPATGLIVDANPAACGFYGYTHEQITQKPIWEINILPPDQVRAEMEKAATDRRTFFRFVHQLASGELRDVEVHSGPIQVGGRTLLYSIVQDVTDRNRAQDALQKSEEKHRSIFDFAPVGIYQSGQDGTIVTANAALAVILGYESVDELLEKNMVDDIYADPSQRTALIEEHGPRGRAHDLELLWMKKDGTPIWVQLTAHAIPDPDGSKIHYEGFVQDITERKLAEQTMSSQLAAMSASIDGIAILDASGRFLYVNEATTNLYGYAESEMIGQLWSMVLDDREAERLDAEVRPRLLAQKLWRGEATGRRRDGLTFPQELSLGVLDNGEVVCVARDTTERTYAEEQIRHLAYHDALTGLPNRLLFKDRLNVAVSRAQRDASSVGVLFLDLDRFKVINDSLGHNTGDQLLQAVAQRVSTCLRETDTVARLGGDEFTIMLPLLGHSENAVRVAEKILDAVRHPFLIDGRSLYTSTSIGISVFPDDGGDAETLIKCADTAMYQAKEHGRDNYQLFNARINAIAMERLNLVGGLRHAIQNNELVLHYQPIYNLATGRVHGMEALLRWQTPSKGLISPDEFIPLAEASGLMPTIGAWVMRTACRQAKAWRDLGFADMTLAVNLSVTQLQQVNLVDEILGIIRETGIRADSLELEITESTAMNSPEISTLVLRELKRHGLRISLDDFGTGHSSLSYLRSLPIDTIKIDKSFVRDLDADPSTAAIVMAIIAMASSLRLKVVAEGVEHEAQRVFLSAHGCEYMQGFLFDRAMPASEFELLLESNQSPRSL